jgi:hypothetical protein
LAEEAIVFAGTFIANLEGRAGSVQSIHEHSFTRRMQPELLLILKRAHGGERPEMVMQRGDAHAHDFREFFHAEWLREVRFDQAIAFAVRWL